MVNSYHKGASGEREFINLVDRMTSGSVRLQRNLTQCRDGGDDCIGYEGLSIEIKRRANAADSDVAKWWKQTVKNCGSNLPVLAWRRDYQSWKVLVHAHHDIPLNDVRGCLSMSLELFCHCLTHPGGLRCGL